MESRTDNISWLQPTDPFQKTYAPTTLIVKNEKAIGIPMINRNIRAQNKMRRIAHHSMITNIP